MIKLSFNFSVRLFRKGGQADKTTAWAPTGKRFLAQAEELIGTLEQSRAKSTIDNYRTAVRSLTTFADERLRMSELSQPLIEGWQQWLQQQGITLNTISCYMRSLRAIISHLDSEAAARSLFKTVYTGKARTDKRSIPLDELNHLQQLPLDRDSPLAFARDIFLFCVYTLGMPFVDVAHLRRKQLADGYITYHRQKTGQRIRIKIEPPMQQIIDRYVSDENPYVFPILPADRPEAPCDYERARSRYNRFLRHLGELAGISRPLTSYVARHSWATMAWQSDVALPVISKALGHTSPNTTLTYIREIDDQRIDVANHTLLTLLTQVT